ncbi:MAG: UDP-N-acetylmuramoyl-L-alanine--D-glutamate ligase [Candidatus Hydrogenedentes bacterium]|nr:UDP-N-acetylmuramoyl-L-alanine--D-glutamate ligase [Candidatus Hydrogenedentota bacterium]
MKTKDQCEILNFKKALVIGAGKSGISVSKLLLKLGKQVVVTDVKEEKELSESAEILKSIGVKCHFGGHPIELLDNVNIVLVSPGVPPNIPILKSAFANKIPVLGEFDFSTFFIEKPIIAVTGTNGKTTVATWIYHTIKNLGYEPALAGNIDVPLSEVALSSENFSHIVAEVSSYQLEYSKYFHPWIAGVLNVTPDHLSRHGSIEEYAKIKNKIFENQEKGDLSILNFDDYWTRKMCVPPEVEIRYFSISNPLKNGVWVDKLEADGAIYFKDKVVGGVKEIPLPGRHNIANALSVLAMLGGKLAEPEKVFREMGLFRGVPHRIEFVGEKGGVKFYNDSKSTNVDSLRVALESFQAPLILIAGGRGKGYGYDSLKDLVGTKVVFLITIGEDAKKIEDTFSGIVQFARVSSMEEAVELAWKKSYDGCVVLLSPGCASFDMYPNFEVRGNHYKECVKKIIGGDI